MGFEWSAGPMFRPVGKPRVAEEIVQQLRALILRGDYAGGDKLPPERKLAEELGVNRASLREAIKSLEHMGLVKTRQGDGTRVLDFMQTAGVELVSHSDLPGRRRRAQPADSARRARFPSLVRQGDGAAGGRARHRRRPQEAGAGGKERAADQLSIDVNELLKLDFEFYVLISYAAKNRVMQLLINTMRAAVTSYAPFFAQFYPPAAAVRKHHKELIKAISQKDAETASKLTEGYMKKAIETLGTVARGGAFSCNAVHLAPLVRAKRSRGRNVGGGSVDSTAGPGRRAQERSVECAEARRTPGPRRAQFRSGAWRPRGLYGEAWCATGRSRARRTGNAATPLSFAAPAFLYSSPLSHTRTDRFAPAATASRMRSRFPAASGHGCSAAGAAERFGGLRSAPAARPVSRR